MGEKCNEKHCVGVLQLATVDKKFVVFICSDCNKPYVYRRIAR
jgi:hypothetical protein